MNDHLKNEALEELVIQGMTMKQAEHEVEFNIELFMKVRIKYGLGLKTDYLISTDAILKDILKTITGD